jgi:hypothetical protein
VATSRARASSSAIRSGGKLLAPPGTATTRPASTRGGSAPAGRRRAAGAAGRVAGKLAGVLKACDGLRVADVIQAAQRRERGASIHRLAKVRIQGL